MKNTLWFQWKISLRNLAIFLIAVLAVVFIAEKSAVSYKAVPVASTEERAEDTNIKYMMIQKTPPEHLSALTFSESLVSDYFGIEVPEKDGVCYPLIDLKTSETYDENTVNIVVIGDSFVWGDGCTNRNEMFWRLTERDLRTAGYNCRVYGVGIGAANAYEELSWLTQSSLLDDLQPDIVIFGFVHNDPADGVRLKFLLENNDLHLSERYPAFGILETAFPSVYTALSNLIAADTLLNGKYGDEEYAVYLEEVLNNYCNGFVIPLNDFAARADFPVAVMTLPSMPQNLRLKKLHEKVAKLYQSADNVRFYDATKQYNRYCSNSNHKNNLYMSNANDHPGTAANRFYADYIVSFLLKDYSDILRPCSKKDLASHTVAINDTMPPLQTLTELSSSETYAQYRFEYPVDEQILVSQQYQVYVSSLLHLPVGKPYVKLCFEAPVRIAELSLSGDGLADAEIWYTAVNGALRYDDRETKPFGEKADGFCWKNKSRDLVSSVLISAQFLRNADRTLTVSIRGNEEKE